MNRFCLLSSAAIALIAQPLAAAPLTDSEQNSRPATAFVQIAQNQNQNNNQSGNQNNNQNNNQNSNQNTNQNQNQNANSDDSTAPDAVVTAATSAAAEKAADHACFYEDAGYKGEKFCTTGATHAKTIGQGWDNRISSIKIAGGLTVKVCTDANYGGSCMETNASVEKLAGDYDDAVSSWQVK